MQNLTLFIGRLGLALLFIVAGAGKLAAYAATQKLLAAHGLAPGLLPLVLVVELGGGALILTGLATRTAAGVLVVFTLATALLFHADFAAAGQLTQFMKNLAIAGGLLLLAAQGPGGWSFDAWRRRRKQRQKIFY